MEQKSKLFIIINIILLVLFITFLTIEFENKEKYEFITYICLGGLLIQSALLINKIKE